MHRRADHVDADRDERIEVVVERIAERRREHHRTGRTGLVMVVDDLREPLEVLNPRDVHRLGLIQHVEVTIVVVTDVLLIETRDVHVALERVRVLHVPVRDELHPVRIRVNGQDDQVVQEAHRLRIGAADQLIRRLDQLVRAEDFGGVETAVEPDDGFAFARRARVASSSVPSPIARRRDDVLVAVELLEVLRRRDDRHELRATFGRLPDLLHDHAVGLGVDLLPVFLELIVVRQLPVVADVEPEEFLRGCYLGAPTARTAPGATSVAASRSPDAQRPGRRFGVTARSARGTTGTFTRMTGPWFSGVRGEGRQNSRRAPSHESVGRLAGGRASLPTACVARPPVRSADGIALPRLRSCVAERWLRSSPN